MTSAALRVFLVSAALALGACTSMGAGGAASTTAPVTNTPSPHAGCSQQTATIYFSDEVQSDQPVAMPLLNTLMDQVHACEHAGGQLRGITISASADPGQSESAATAQIERRQQRVRDALVRLGAPGNKIHFAPAGQASADAIMAKRADVVADLY
ncbi:MAG: hypothetical protein QM759_17790 [Terricaulis sp.]